MPLHKCSEQQLSAIYIRIPVQYHHMYTLFKCYQEGIALAQLSQLNCLKLEQDLSTTLPLHVNPKRLESIPPKKFWLRQELKKR